MRKNISLKGLNLFFQQKYGDDGSKYRREILDGNGCPKRHAAMQRNNKSIYRKCAETTPKHEEQAAVSFPIQLIAENNLKA